MPPAEPSATPRSAPRAPSAGPRRFQFTGSLYETSVYVERPADGEIVGRLLRGEYCHVLAPRQIGKSSLRVRVARKLADDGVRCASVDLTAVGTPASLDEWYFGLAEEVARRLGLADPLEFWEANRGAAPSRRWADYLRRALAEDLAGQRVVIMLDEIEAVRTVPFGMDDFFTVIRALYEARSSDEVCRRLTFCLIGVTTPNDLIKDKLITPFNVSHGIRLEDFSRAQMATLAGELSPLAADVEALISAVHAWTDGHPYMTMRICAALAEQARTAAGDERRAVEAVVRKEFLERPLEDPNLNYAARRFDDPSYEQHGVTLTDKVSLYERVQGGEPVPSDVESAVEMELRLAGMVKDVAEGGRRVLRPRNRIFTTAFDRTWLRSKGDRRFIAESVWKWRDEEKNASYLLRGDALAQAVEWARTAILSNEEAEFLAASQREERDALERQRTQVAGEIDRIMADKGRAEQEKTAAETRVVNARKRLVWLALAAALVALAGITVVAGLNRNIAERRAQLDQTQRDLQRSKDEVTKNEGLITKLEADIASAQSDLANARSLLAAATKDRDDAQAKLLLAQESAKYSDHMRARAVSDRDSAVAEKEALQQAVSIAEAVKAAALKRATDAEAARDEALRRAAAAESGASPIKGLNEPKLPNGPVR